MALEEYAFTFAYWGSWAMFPFFFYPLIICWNIIKHGFSDFLPPNTFIDGLVRCILYYQYGKLLQWNDMMQNNLYGITLQIIYFFVHFYYLYDKKKCYIQFVKSGIFVGIALAYVNWESTSASQRFELILTILNYSSLIYPLLGVKYLLQNKCTFWMPYPIIFGGQVVCTLWLLFAISVHNYLLMVQLLLSFILGAIQITLYFVYPKFPESNFSVTYTPPKPSQQFQPVLFFTPRKKEVKDRKTRLEEARLRKQNALKKKSGNSTAN